MAAKTPRPPKAQRTQEAREAARRLHEEQRRKARRKGILIKVGVLVAVVLVIALVAAIILQNRSQDIADAGPAPAGGNQYGGITLTADGLEETPATTVDRNEIPPAGPNGLPGGVGAAPAGEPAQIVIYADMGCPFCAQFEEQNHGFLSGLVEDGEATVEYRIATFLDRVSTTNYSSRAANAVACVADTSPQAFEDYLGALFAQQPAEGGAGLDNAALARIAGESGAGDVGGCIEDGTFRPWAQFTNETFNAYQVGGTPAVFVQGQEWDPQADPDFAAWAQEAIGRR